MVQGLRHLRQAVPASAACALNDERVVELTDPATCTGCRLCEWLCPDFAIRVHLDPVDAAAGAQA